METQHTKQAIGMPHHPLALTQLYRKVYPIVRSYIIKHGGTTEDVEDIMQEASLRLLSAVKTKPLNIHTNAYGFFIGICKNLWKEELRNRKKQDMIAKTFNTEYIVTNKVLDQLIQKDNESLFQKHFSKLNKTSQIIWELFFEGKNAKEIANLTGYSEGYVRKKKCQSKKNLLQMIQRDMVYRELAI